MQAIYDAWTNVWPITPTNVPADYRMEPQFSDMVSACRSAAHNMKFLVERMQADPEFNRFCLVVYDAVVSPELVVEPTNNLDMERCVRSVRLFRAVHPFTGNCSICSGGGSCDGVNCCCGKNCNCNLDGVAIVGFCGEIGSGKTTAATIIGGQLFAAKKYAVHQWSFGLALKRFCAIYYDGNGTEVSLQNLFSYYHNKNDVPAVVEVWKKGGAVDLPAADRISELLILPTKEMAVKVWGRLLNILSSDFHESPLKLTRRRLMQVTGSAFRDVCGLNFWIKQLANLIMTTSMAGHGIHLIDDVRFPNEAAWLKSMGGKIVRIVDSSHQDCQATHISEMECASIPTDYVFDNSEKNIQGIISGLLPYVFSVINPANV